MDSRKKKIFVGAAVGAVALVAGLLILNPDFPREDASGAIGAVQKHRETQIAAKDVVLTDQATRRLEQTLYADFLSDAAKLDNMSAELGIIAILIGNRDQSLGAKQNIDDGFMRRLNNVEVALENHSVDLQNRYLASMTESLNSLTKLASEEQVTLGDSSFSLESLTADVENLSSRVKNRQQLESAEMVSLNSRLQSFSEQLGTESAMNMQNFSAELSNVVDSLENAESLNNEVVLSAVSSLQSFSEQLNSSDSLSLSMSDRIEYLGSLALQHKTLTGARTELNSFADALQAGNRADLQNGFDDLSASLGNDAVTLESMALDNLSSRLQSAADMDAALGNMEAMLGSSRKQIESRSAALESRAVGSFTEALSNLTEQLQSRQADLQSRTALSMQFELASIEAYLENREQLESREDAALQNRNQLGTEAQLENRDQLSDRQSLASFETHLANLSAALESKNGLGSKIQNRQQLESQSMMLESKAEQLQAKNIE